MKILFSWICDHIAELSQTTEHPEALVLQIAARLNAVTAEVGHIETIDLSSSRITLGTYVQRTDGTMGWNTLDGQSFADATPWKTSTINGWYWLFKTKDWGLCRLTGTDLGGVHPQPLPEVQYATPGDAATRHLTIPQRDYCFHIDNQAITHRPDLWNHRGWAREIAAIMGYTLMPESSLCSGINPQEAINTCVRQAPYAIGSRTSACNFTASIAYPHITIQKPLHWMALRLSMVDLKPINSLVDITNYVLADIGQPLHAYDASKLRGQLEARAAHPQEKLTLLNGATVELCADDIVIADTQGPCALAGIMGSATTAITATTESCIIEAAGFDPIAVRESARRHSLRTDAAVRFEKGIGTGTALLGILRAKALIALYCPKTDIPTELACHGTVPEPQKLTCTHETLEQKIGIQLDSSMVQLILERLDFNPIVTDQSGTKSYTVTIPLFRGNRTNYEVVDVVEEVARLVGYDSIPHQMPTRATRPTYAHRAQQIRMIKQHLAFGWNMQECNSHALFDEALLAELGISCNNAVSLKNPISNQWTRLVTSLVPHLLKVIHVNRHEHEQIACFEINATWNMHAQAITEHQSLAFLVYDQTKDVYDIKQIVCSLARLLQTRISWQPTTTAVPCWLDQAHSAALLHNSELIGLCGKVSCTVLDRYNIPGSVWAVELNIDPLLEIPEQTYTYRPVSKYPPIIEDISIMLPFNTPAADVITLIKTNDARITHATIHDMFHKHEWGNKRAITVRCTLRDEEGTMLKEEARAIMDRIRSTLQAVGVEVRS